MKINRYFVIFDLRLILHKFRLAARAHSFSQFHTCSSSLDEQTQTQAVVPVSTSLQCSAISHDVCKGYWH